MESNRPEPGSVWKHFKHTPKTPHIYEVVCTTEAGEFLKSIYPVYTVVHTETEELMDLLVSFEVNTKWLNPGQAESFVIYRSVDSIGAIWWARPLSSFLADDPRSASGKKFLEIKKYPRH